MASEISLHISVSRPKEIDIFWIIIIEILKVKSV